MREKWYLMKSWTLIRSQGRVDRWRSWPGQSPREKKRRKTSKRDWEGAAMESCCKCVRAAKGRKCFKGVEQPVLLLRGQGTQKWPVNLATSRSLVPDSEVDWGMWGGGNNEYKYLKKFCCEEEQKVLRLGKQWGEGNIFIFLFCSYFFFRQKILQWCLLSSKPQ